MYSHLPRSNTVNMPTNTISLALRRALRLLGIHDVYHGFAAVMENPRDNEFWVQAFEGKFEGKGKPFGRAEFDKLLGHCQGAMDNPCLSFAEDLVAAYPEAKVILTLRPVDDWHRSHAATVHKMKTDIAFRLVSWFGWYLRLHWRYTLPGYHKSINHMFKGLDFDTHGRQIFEDHNNMIRSLVPKDRLLELHLGDGWDPLCKFLGVERPDVEYPTGNSIAECSKTFEGVFMVWCTDVAKRLGWCVLMLLCVLWSVRSLFIYATS